MKWKALKKGGITSRMKVIMTISHMTRINKAITHPQGIKVPWDHQRDHSREATTPRNRYRPSFHCITRGEVTPLAGAG